MRAYLLICAVVFPTVVFAQIEFEKGYFIDNAGERTTCLIRNKDWDGSPKEFSYKISADGEKQEHSINDVAEFGVDHFSRYVRVVLPIDRSADVNGIKEELYQWPLDTVFVKQLVHGKATLYEYKEKSFLCFFYQVDENPIAQLLLQEFRYPTTPDHSDLIATKNEFRKQLERDVTCEGADGKSARILGYYRSAMKKYFIAYNKCMGSYEEQAASEKKERTLGKLHLRPTVSMGFVSEFVDDLYTYDMNNYDYDFGKATQIRPGFELEYVFPFRQGTWSALLTPQYEQYNKSGEDPDTQWIHYKAVVLPLGLRRYFFLTKSTRLFLDAFYSLTLPIEGTIQTVRYVELNQKYTLNYAVGAGMAWKIFSAEFRYYGKQNSLRDYTYWGSDYKAMTVTLGVQIF